jgi:hypothetical protein
VKLSSKLGHVFFQSAQITGLAGISSGQMSCRPVFLYLKSGFIEALFCHGLTNEIVL